MCSCSTNSIIVGRLLPARLYIYKYRARAYHVNNNCIINCGIIRIPCNCWCPTCLHSPFVCHEAHMPSMNFISPEMCTMQNAHSHSLIHEQPASQTILLFRCESYAFSGCLRGKVFGIQHTAYSTHTHTCGESAATRDSKLKYNYNATPSLLIVLLLRAAAMLAIRRRMAKVFPIKYLKVYNSHLFAGSALAHTHTHRTLIISFTIKYNKVWHTTFRND